jgi:hypothetical protein
MKLAFPAAGLLLGMHIPLLAQQPQSLDGKTAEQVYKNIQVLKGTPADQLGQSMHVIKGSFGLDCEECHVVGALTGLLLRKWTALPTQAGNSPFQVDFDDYRDTGSGVKFAYLIKMLPAGSRTELAPTATINVSKVEDNVPIESAKFNEPQSR